jgi:ribonuclease P protein component
MDGHPGPVPQGADTRRQDRGLSRDQRITDRHSFKNAFDRGRRASGNFLVMWVLDRDGGIESPRLGVVASKRLFPRAVERSRARRLMREAFRLNRWRFKGTCDVVLVGRRAILGVKRQDVEKDLLNLATKAGLAPGGTQ